MAAIVDRITTGARRRVRVARDDRRGKKTIHVLTESETAGSDELARALERCHAGEHAAAEVEWHHRIEGRRQQLLESNELLEPMERGAELSGVAANSDTLSISEICLGASKPPAWTRLLFTLVREFRPERCLEMGTCLGISGAYLAAALEMNGKGHLHTIEGAPSRSAVASQGFGELGLDQRTTTYAGAFQRVLANISSSLAPIDFLFIDGHHDGPATIEYFDLLSQHLAPRSLVVFDDIHWSEGMSRAWERLTSEQRFSHSVDLGEMGVCLLDDARAMAAEPLRYRI